MDTVKTLAPGFNTQPPEGGWPFVSVNHDILRSFNTQPPEGGWRLCILPPILSNTSFNTQPPEGGWAMRTPTVFPECVSTHSRPKAAGVSLHICFEPVAVSTHSRPKAAGAAQCTAAKGNVCFNTQPPEGGWSY